MTSPNSKDTEKTYNKFINLNKSPMNTNNKSDLIQNIPKLNLHDGFNSERNTKFTKKPKIININFDKQSFSPSNNNLDIDNEKNMILIIIFLSNHIIIYLIFMILIN